MVCILEFLLNIHIKKFVNAIKNGKGFVCKELNKIKINY